MTETHLLLTLPALALAALVFLPSARANANIVLVRTLVTSIACMQFAIASGFALALASGWTARMHFDLFRLPSDLPMAATIYYDEVASLMFALVSFVGWVICQYSVRYMDGEAAQGSYFRWTGFTIGAASLMVISGNLMLFIAAWVMTSLGLHQLLLHYGHRPAARRAAWTKFAVSRLGDMALIVAAAIIYDELKTLEFPELHAIAGSITGASSGIQIACLLLVVGAVTKSAQFPFHTWLPQTMDTPTPVSALMHAGIVNAGGYLMIRTSPLIGAAPWAMTTLAIVGGLTAGLATVVMLTQTSIKRSLAYSTIAQMGFMMLQCGLGAFSAAMLHIVAHSLYKAYAFLSSGCLTPERRPVHDSMRVNHRFQWLQIALSGILVVACLGLSFWVCGIHPLKKPGGLLLGGVLCIALTQWILQAIQSGDRVLTYRAISVTGGLCLVYSATFRAVDSFISESLPGASSPEMFWLVAATAVVIFGALVTLQTMLASGYGISFLNKWHVHAYNGFYLESIYRRVFGPLMNS